MDQPQEGMIVHTEEGTFRLPAFYVDTHETEEENRERLREHIDEHAFDMPRDAKVYTVGALIKHAFPMALQMRFYQDLENLRPEDFREEDEPEQ